MFKSPILKVKHSELAQDSIWLNGKNLSKEKLVNYIFHPMINETYTTKDAVKQNISACGRSAKSRVKIIAPC